MTIPPIDHASLVADRRDLHQHPELAFQEHRTAGIVAERMRSLGYAVTVGVGGTGVVATRTGGGRCVLVRADMDALPVEEANDVPYRSRHAGRMHACGHDGHVAMGLEVGRRLAAAPLPGTVKFAFQPAEEMNNGAAAMIEAGVLAAPRVDAAFGVHLWNYLPVGTIGVMPGPVMAAVDLFDVTVVGRGGHAAAPHLTVDPVVVAAQIVTNGEGAQVGAAAAAKVTFSVEAATLLGAWWHRIRTSFAEHTPWTWLVPATFAILLLGWQLRSRFSFRVERRGA